MKVISSKDNPLFRQFKRLVDSPRERRKTGYAMLDGVHLLSASLSAGIVPEYVICSADGLADSEIRALLEKIPADRKIELSPALFRALSPVDTPSGVLAVITIPQLAIPEKLQWCLLLEEVQDPGNLGAILRSAAAAGVQAAYLSAGCADAWSPKVLRSGMGAHFVMAIEEGASLLGIAGSFHGMTVATSLQAEKSLYEVDLRGPVAFLLGNEGAGLSPELVAAVNVQVRVPMPGHMESLNVAAAAAVCLFERVRQRHLL